MCRYTAANSAQASTALRMDDVMDIFHQNNISFNYHSFNEYSFGLHNGSGLPTAENRNDTLYQVLVDKLKKYAE